VPDGGLDIPDHAHGENQVEILRIPIFLAGRLAAGDARPRGVAAAQRDSASRRHRGELRQEGGCGLLVHEQGFQGVTHAGTLAFGVLDDGQRLVKVGVVIDEHMADAFVMLEHRHARLIDHGADQ